MKPSARLELFSRAVSSIHCIGVGGMGVAPLAIYLAQSGFTVTGEDDALTPDVRALLEREGVVIGTLPTACELVAYSSAIGPAHPSYAAAMQRGLPLVRRGELLAEVVRGKKLVAVCGSHGKTTTTALLITALRAAHFPAGYILGGRFADGTPPARAGENDWVVAEIDESDGTIDRFAPELTVTVNLDWDHPDHYRALADLERTFAELFARTRRGVLVSESCGLSARVAGRGRGSVDAAAPAAGGSAQILSFGRTGDFSATIESESAGLMTLKLGGRFAIASAVVRAAGEFNGTNATAALAAAQWMGVAVTSTLLAAYAGVRRRQTILHEADGVTVIEDYAHHPAEIRALLGSLRKRMGETGRLWVVFQPHRFSRTAQFKAEFAAALALADRIELLDVYAAGEAAIAGGTTADVQAELQRIAPGRAVNYRPGNADTERFRALNEAVRSGDLVAFVGAGDVDRQGRAWVQQLQKNAMNVTAWEAMYATLAANVSPGTKLKREETLGGKTTLRVGGPARIYAEPATTDDLRALLREAAARGVAVYLLGRGSNLIVPDEGVEGLVISLGHESWATFDPRPKGRVWAGAGLRLKNLCGLATKTGLAGFEFLEGIPGTVGGALRMNAGAMGGWMFDVVEEVQIMTLAGELKTLARETMHVSYRHCAELNHAIAIGALLRPVALADADSVSRQIDVYRRKRQESQPREPSAGCIFKNPTGNSAGRLIDESGLKGERVGDAEVSSVHANFIVNRGRATAADVLELVRRVRARVREVKGVDLEPEVLLYGKDWKDVL